MHQHPLLFEHHTKQMMANRIITESSLTRPIRQDDTIIAIAASIHPPPSSSNNKYLEMHHHN
jgi:hypothetical protein